MKPFKNYILTFLLLLVFTGGKAQILYPKAFGSANADDGYDIIITHDSSYMLLGKTNFSNLYLAKVDTVGNLIWEKTYITFSNNMEPFSICEIGDTSFVIAGRYSNQGFLFKVNAVGDTLVQFRDTVDTPVIYSNLRVAPDGNLLALVTRNGIVSLVKFDNNLNVVNTINNITPTIKGIEVVNTKIYLLKRDSIDNFLIVNNDFSQIDTISLPVNYPDYLKLSFDKSKLIIEGTLTSWMYSSRKRIFTSLIGNVELLCDSINGIYRADFTTVNLQNDWIYANYNYNSTWGQDIYLHFANNCGQVLHDTILYRGGTMGDPWREEWVVKLLVDQNGNYVLFGRAEKGPLGDWDILLWIYKKWDGFPTSVEETDNDKLTIENSIAIYPNPTQNQFTVSGITENSSITIMDVMGKVVHYAPNTINQTQITTENWAKGLYVVQIKGNKSSTTLKVIKG